MYIEKVLCIKSH